MVIENEKITCEKIQKSPIQNTIKTVTDTKQKSKQNKKTANTFLNTGSFKKVPSQLNEMQQVFNERYYNAPVSTSDEKSNAPTGNKDAQKNTPPSFQGDGGQNPLSQIAPFFNLLSGGKNSQIGNLISALGSGNMDMNKMISAMVQNQTTSANAHTSSSNSCAIKDNKTTTTTNPPDSTIKNLNRI